MIRIRTGNRWKSERKLRGAAVADEAWDALGIEVDGIDISQGLLEGRLLSTLSSLVEAVDDLAAGRRRSAQVGFPSGVVLLLSRRGASILVSLVRLVRPSKVLVKDVEVDLPAFALAAADSARDLLDGLAARYPHAEDHPLVRALAEKATLLLDRLAFDGPPPAEEEAEASHIRRPPARGEVPTLVFDIRDEEGRIAGYREGDGLGSLLLRGHLYLHGPDGEELASTEGYPFLILRDLVSLSGRLVAPDGDPSLELPLGAPGPVLEVDLRGGALTVEGRTLRVELRDLARSIFTCALDFAAVLASRQPALGRNPYLVDLQDEAKAQLRLLDDRESATTSAAPLPASPKKPPTLGRPPATGDLRKVSLRIRWRAELEPVRRVASSKERVWISHVGGVTALDLGDGSRTDYPYGMAVAVPERTGPALLLEEGGVLFGIDEKRLTWKRDTGFAELDSSYCRHRGDAWLLVDRASLVCMNLRTGEKRCRLDPPAAHRALLASAGPFLALAADNGMLYAVDLARREVAWRLPITLLALAVGPEGVVGIAEGARGLEAVGISAKDRSILFREPLPLDAVGQLVATRWGTVVAGASETGGEVLGLSAEGKLRFRARPVLGPGAPALTMAGRTIFARGPRGICRIDRGRIRWSAPASPGAAPRIVHGMLALPGERLSLRDAASGRELLPEAARSELAADHLEVGPRDELLAVDIHGSCAGLRVAGALAVVA